MNAHTPKSKNWSPEEIADLKTNYRNESTAQIAVRLNRSLNSVRSKAAYLGLGKSGRSAWTETDLNYLRKNYKSKRVQELAQYCERLPGVVRQKLYQMRLCSQCGQGAYSIAFTNDRVDAVCAGCSE
jgi:hypothetical protein